MTPERRKLWKLQELLLMELQVKHHTSQVRL